MPLLKLRAYAALVTSQKRKRRPAGNTLCLAFFNKHASADTAARNPKALHQLVFRVCERRIHTAFVRENHQSTFFQCICILSLMDRHRTISEVLRTLPTLIFFPDRLTGRLFRES